MSARLSIVLQKSKVASARIFGETLKRETIDDSDSLSRAIEVADEFSVRRWGLSDLYMKTAPAALRIFDTFGKTTFATLSGAKRKWSGLTVISGFDPIRELNRIDF
jgi:hypothetical protein